MTEYVMKCHGFAVDIPCEWVGWYLMEFTPHARVKGTWTADIKRAMKFASKEAAMELWMTSIGTRPWDGKPDRPLTAFTIEVLSVEAANDQR